MARARIAATSELGNVLAEIFAVNERMNQLVLEHLQPGAWLAEPPGSKGRTIAAIFTHMHNVRLKWLRLSAPHLKAPGPLNRTRCTQAQAEAALAESGARCCEMIAEALRPDGRIEKFRRDGWGKAWTPGAAMLAYMITHEAHHRGQVCMLAHQLGFPLPKETAYGIWVWEKLWKQCGFTEPR